MQVALALALAGPGVEGCNETERFTRHRDGLAAKILELLASIGKQLLCEPREKRVSTAASRCCCRAHILKPRTEAVPI